MLSSKSKHKLSKCGETRTAVTLKAICVATAGAHTDYKLKQIYLPQKQREIIVLV